MALDVLGKVASVSGKNDKLKILKDNAGDKELADLLDATFNYKRRFFINKWDMPEPLNKSLPGSRHKNFINLLSQLETRTIVGNTARDAVEDFFSDCDTFEQEWYAKVLRKDLKAGFSDKTAVKAGFVNIPIFEVMLAKDGKTCKKAAEIVEKGVYVTPKFDGYRCLAVVDKGAVTLYSRNGTVYNNFPEVEKALIESFPTGQHIFDGEIMSDDFEAMQKSAFANKRGTTVGDVKYHVFGYVPFDEWQNQKFKMKTAERLDILYKLGKSFVGDRLKIVKHKLVNTLADIYALEKQYISQGYEGAMALPNIPYYVGKKSNKLLKFKTMVSEDCEIVGYYEGKEGSKYEGMFGGFIVRQENGKECEVGSGFSDEDREYIWNNRSDFLGKIIEVKYQEKTSHDIMRFPIFMRYRNDK